MTSLQRVPRGTEGAISAEGTLAGLGAAAAFACTALLLHQVSARHMIGAQTPTAFLQVCARSYKGEARLVALIAADLPPCDAPMTESWPQCLGNPACYLCGLVHNTALSILNVQHHLLGFFYETQAKTTSKLYSAMLAQLLLCA